MMSAEDLVQRFGSPLYVYDEDDLRSRCRSLLTALPDCAFHYAMKANSNRAILDIVRQEGLYVDAVSVGEVLAAIDVGFSPDAISFNGNSINDEELRAVAETGTPITVDSISQLERYGRLFPNTRVGVRINPDVGDGHHDHVITGGPESKFGIDTDDLEDAWSAANRHGLLVDGLQQHVGSGILDPEVFIRAVEVMLRTADGTPGLSFVDFGGGFGVGYKPGEEDFDVLRFSELLRPILEPFKVKHPGVSIRFEPGRWVVASCGTLYVTVTSIKRGKRHTFVGTDSGLNHLLRPALYGSWHTIENVSRPDARPERVTVTGNICEAGDLFARDRLLPMPREGDLLAIRHTGAYGWSMGSCYNLRPLPAEVMVGPDGPRCIRNAQPPWT